VDNSENQESTNCKGRHYCGHWRKCDRCAAIRAARFADRAEYLEHRHGKLALAIAKPASNDAASIKHLHGKLLRQKLAPSGLWTIETGELFAGLHLNLLIPAENMHQATGSVEHIEIVRTTARAAAAYISKRKGMPTERQYSGRLLGEWGSCIQHLMRSDNLQAAPCQAAALAMALEGKRSIADYYKTDKQIAEKIAGQHLEKQEKTRDEYAAIMRRNLSAVYLAINWHT